MPHTMVGEALEALKGWRFVGEKRAPQKKVLSWKRQRMREWRCQSRSTNSPNLEISTTTCVGPLPPGSGTLRSRENLMPCGSCYGKDTIVCLWCVHSQETRDAVSTSQESRTISRPNTPSTMPTTPPHHPLPLFTLPHPLLPTVLPHPPAHPPLQFHPPLPPCPLPLRHHLPTGRRPPPDLLLGLLSRTRSLCSVLSETLGRRLLRGVRTSLSH